MRGQGGGCTLARMDYRHRALAALLACAAPLGAGVGAAEAKKKVRYKVTISGSQVTTWEYRKQMAPRCDFPEEETGEQEIKFKSLVGPKEKVTFVKGRKGKVTMKPVDMVLAAQTDIERRYKTLYTRITPCGGGGTYGGDGGGPAKDAIGKDSCFQFGALRLGLFTKKGKSPMRFRTTPHYNDIVTQPFTFPAACSADNEYVPLGLVEHNGEYEGNLVESTKKLPAKKLFGKKTKKLTISGSRVLRYPNSKQSYAGPPKTTGKTILAWNLRLKRVR